MTPAPFVSYAQNAEDVVLHRALGYLPMGHYLEIGANHPTEDSISRSFYDCGWSGIIVEPMVQLIEAHRLERQRDTQVHAVAGRPGTDRTILHEIAGTGLSTTIDSLRDVHENAGFTSADVEVRSLTVDQILDSSTFDEIHFVVIDTEGSEDDVLAGFDLRRWRPWILVIEATVPNSNQPAHGSWEPQVLDSGYQFCLFDGLSRFYVADEHAAALKEKMSFPANVLDTYVRYRDLETRTLATTLSDEVIRWRSAALTRWAEAVHNAMGSEDERAIISALRTELELTRNTVSWRVTAPLRTIRKHLPE